MELKQVALAEVHASLGAKMVPFAGFNMPVRYSSDLEEHHTVRNGVGVFDVSHMGEFLVKGPGALPLIQWVTTNDASFLQPGKIQYSCIPNGEGGIIDDLLVYNIGPEEYLLVVNAGNIEKDWAWLNFQNAEEGFGAELIDISAETSLFAVQGPLATDALQPLADIGLSSLAYYTFAYCTFAGLPNILVSATGYTGSGGYEIYVPNQYAKQVWDAIFKAGEPYNIKPIGLGARDTLRLEMGFCLYGNDITEDTSPIAAGLGWITKFSKSFIDSSLFQAQKSLGTPRKLCGFIMQEKGVPRSHYKVQNALGETIGEVTSGTQSPTLGVGIGLAYLLPASSKPGTEIYINIRDRALKAIVVKLPFYQKA